MSTSNHWTYARPSSTVRNCESLMKVEVRNICAKFSGLSYSDKCIEVCTVNVDLSPSVVNESTDLTYCSLENTVSRWVCDHQRSKSASMLCNLCFDVIDRNVSVFVALDNNNFHSRHNRRCSVGSMCARWNQADIACLVTSRIVVITNCEQSSEFSLATGIRLQRNRVVTSDSN